MTECLEIIIEHEKEQTITNEELKSEFQINYHVNSNGRCNYDYQI